MVTLKTNFLIDDNKVPVGTSASSRLPAASLSGRKREAGFCTISISDNGPGIPDSIKDKIFQPFFTTKPTGQGTGLGLSLAYDIIKAHGGNIQVNSDFDQGSTFIIQLPAIP